MSFALAALAAASAVAATTPSRPTSPAHPSAAPPRRCCVPPALTLGLLLYLHVGSMIICHAAADMAAPLLPPDRGCASWFVYHCVMALLCAALPLRSPHVVLLLACRSVGLAMLPSTGGAWPLVAPTCCGGRGWVVHAAVAAAASAAAVAAEARAFAAWRRGDDAVAEMRRAGGSTAATKKVA